MKFKQIILFFMMISLCSCYYDNKEEMFIKMDTTCDTVLVTYNATIAPVLNANCTGCHGSSASGTGGGLDFRGYTNASGNINAIIGSVSHQSGFSPMPPNGTKLDNCTIRKFVIWKNNGTPEN